MKRIWPYLGIVLPILVFTYWMGSIYSVAAFGAKVQLAVTGYDPRDLLAGHYLRYRIEYGPQGSCQAPQDEQICVCLESKEGGLAQASWVGSCEAKPSCALWFNARCAIGTIIADIERYYFNESLTEQLQRVPDKSSVELSIDGLGNAVVTGFFIDGQRLG